MKRSLSDMKRETPREAFELTVTPKDGEPVDVVFADPKKMHWTDLASLDELGAGAISVLIPDPEHYQAFRADPEIDGEALEWVMGEWRTHFGLGSPGDSVASTGS